MKTSTVAWTLTALIVVIGIGWYVYANSYSSYVPPASTNTPVVTGPGPDYTGGDMTPTPTTPIASSTSGGVDASTTLNVQ